MSDKKKIVVITTGGTIAGVSNLLGGYDVELSGEEVLSKFPELNQIADIELDDLGVIDSSSIDSTVWLTLVRAIFKHLKRKEVDGIVVTHGTDTMGYTTMAMGLMLPKLNKPVVFTGAMQPIDKEREHVLRHIFDSVFAIRYKVARLGAINVLCLFY